jgi:hypothetical protein
MRTVETQVPIPQELKVLNKLQMIIIMGSVREK